MNDFIAIDRRDSIDATVVIIDGKRMGCILARACKRVHTLQWMSKYAFA
jgi:hypothetical protein